MTLKVKANDQFTTTEVITEQMLEPRPLPMGREEFEVWSERILSGTLIPCEDKQSMKFALASMILHLGPTESHKPDAYFIHSLRKVACNQVAHVLMNEIKEATTARLKAEQDKADVEKEAHRLATGGAESDRLLEQYNESKKEVANESV